MRLVKALFQFYDACHDLAERRDGTEHHPGHPLIVSIKIGEHLVVGSKREGAGSSGGKIEVWPIEEHARMSGAVLSHPEIAHRLPACRRHQEPGDIVVVTGGALAAALEFAASFIPSTQAVEDHHLVPKSAASINSGDIPDVEILGEEIVGNEWPDDHRSMRVKRGLRARFDLDSPANIGVSSGSDGRIPELQTLALRVVAIKLDPCMIGGQACRFERIPQECLDPYAERLSNVALTCGFDRVQAGCSLLSAQRLQLFNRSSLADVLTKDGNVSMSSRNR